MASILNPSSTVAIGIGLGAVDAFIFSTHLPNIADVRSADPQNTDVDTCRRQAAGLCIAINGVVSVMTRDWDVFLIGGIVTVGMAWLYVHANSVHPSTGTMTAPGDAPTSGDSAQMYPLPDYDQASA